MDLLRCQVSQEYPENDCVIAKLCQARVLDLYEFVRDELKLDYVFWGTEEPFNSRDVLPFLHELGRESLLPE
jgi:hypothetical protein